MPSYFRSKISIHGSTSNSRRVFYSDHATRRRRSRRGVATRYTNIQGSCTFRKKNFCRQQRWNHVSRSWRPDRSPREHCVSSGYMAYTYTRLGFVSAARVGLAWAFARAPKQCAHHSAAGERFTIVCRAPSACCYPPHTSLTVIYITKCIALHLCIGDRATRERRTCLSDGSITARHLLCSPFKRSARVFRSASLVHRPLFFAPQSRVFHTVSCPCARGLGPRSHNGPYVFVRHKQRLDWCAE